MAAKRHRRRTLRTANVRSFILFKKDDRKTTPLCRGCGRQWRGYRGGRQIGEIVAFERACSASAKTADSMRSSSAGTGRRRGMMRSAAHRHNTFRHAVVEIDVGRVDHSLTSTTNTGGGATRAALRTHISDRARCGNGVSPTPLPLDQAIVIAEKGRDLDWRRTPT